MKVTRTLLTITAIAAALANPSLAARSSRPAESCYVSTGQRCTTSGGQPGTIFQSCNGTDTVCLATDGNFSPPATLGNGSHVEIGGHALCEEGSVADLRVTITQRGTGAVAEGTDSIDCTGEPAEWRLEAHTTGNAGFVPGPATACGLLTVRLGPNDVADAFQWCKPEIDIEP